MKRTFAIICTLVASAGCQRADRQEEQTLPALPPPAPTAAPTTPNPPPPVEQPSMAEERLKTSGRDTPSTDTDLSAGTKEGVDEEKEGSERSASSSDRAITQRIRDAVMDDSSFSGSAKNIDISTKDGVVTLRGPVRSSQEKSQLTTLASGMQGVKRVDNQLKIAGD